VTGFNDVVHLAPIVQTRPFARNAGGVDSVAALPSPRKCKIQSARRALDARTTSLLSMNGNVRSVALRTVLAVGICGMATIA
jgi:hypothetical protein